MATQESFNTKGFTSEKKVQKALLIAAFQSTNLKYACEEHLAELELLAKTYGIETAGREACPLRKIDPSTYFGKGKVDELIARAKELEADLVIVDEEISPAHQRNLEKLFNLKVMDRTELILGVFAQRAHTKEARLQIELAQVKYQYPRLKRMWSHFSRQKGTAGGGGAYLKGEGEKQIEIDRRLVKKRIEKLQDDIEAVKLNRQTQRLARERSEIPVFAIIGYTNAGKSTLLKALTDAEVFIEDKLFATLDTTTRKFTLANNQDILLIDTVGFIRKLPHLLVAAFKSTLEEALEADILLHLIDASHPMAVEQAEAAHQVLQELNATGKPIIPVLNKIDKLTDTGMLNQLRILYPKTVNISALKKEGLEELQQAMIQELAKQRRVAKLRIPQSDYAVVSEIMRSGKILNQEYDENDVLIKAEMSIPLFEKLKKFKAD